MSTKEMVMKITEETFGVIKKVYDSQKESEGPGNPPENAGSSNPDGKGGSSRIIFPRKPSGKNRISEQELRFIFVEQLNKYADEHKIDIHYSVETPTKNLYKFTGVKESVAFTDLTIHDSEFNRVCLIEFKASNPKEGYEKDYCKLFNEPDHDSCLRFFIQMIKNYDSGTLPNIQDKLDAYKKETGNVAEIHYIGYCLEKGELLEINKDGKLVPKPLKDIKY